MGLFKRKEYTEEQNREFLEESGTPTARGYTRKSKFSAFSQHAAKINAQRPEYSLAPSSQGGQPQSSNPYGGGGGSASSSSSNPYQSNGGGSSSNPYANAQLGYSGSSAPSRGYTAYGRNDTNGGGVRNSSNGYGEYSSSPYGGQTANSSPYGGQSSSGNPHGGSSSRSENPYGGSSNESPYSSSRSGTGDYSARDSNPYAGPSSRSGTRDYSSRDSNPYGGPSPYESKGDAKQQYAQAQSNYASRFGDEPLRRTETNQTARNELFKGVDRSKMSSPAEKTEHPQRDMANISATDELMEMPSELNEGYQPELEQQQQFEDSEDEEIHSIKTQMKQTRGETVNSTRNILEMAARAEESGRNTLGMLGSQAERLANTEQNLALTEIQNNIASDKAKELKRLNRSIFVPNVTFNSKKKMAQQEEKIRQATSLEQQNREARRQLQYESEQRVTQALNSKSSEIANKYRLQNSKADRKKFLFEEDSEDEAQEDEIDQNLAEIHAASGRLKQLALATKDEVGNQLDRLERIGDMADQQEVKTHINIHRLANIK